MKERMTEGADGGRQLRSVGSTPTPVTCPWAVG